jgi:hypothetical protein
VGILGCSGAPEPEAVEVSEDGRQVVHISREQRVLVKAVMRQNLETVHAVLAASAEQDFGRVHALSLAAAKAQGPGSLDPTLKPRLPDAWRANGKQVHRAWGDLAKLSKRPAPAPVVAAHLAEVTAACVACHLQFVVEVP